ncbi:hypothetical protein ACH5RR_038060 [Cinchona calisaya]|uniref:Uncharacterized protein n=1 Tax=Cinchona calisaya TaxID=153742 RepID=A0ABD2Y9A9_9GENT
MEYENSKTLKYLVSVSLFSSILIYSLKFYLSSAALIIPLHDSLDKRWIFLIFNGILVVLLLANNTSAGKLVENNKAAEPFENEVFEIEEKEEEEKDQESLKEEELEVIGRKDDDEEENHDEAEAEGIRTYFIVEDDDHHQENDDGFLLEEQVEEEGEEEGSGIILEKLSEEELNKKFEEFIRKMKQELRIQAQQQLVVMVK